MNMNLVHNVLNVVIVGLSAALVASGCVATVNGAFNCSQSWINPNITTYALAGIGVLKLGMNIYRDGVAGLASKQPPVDDMKK